MADLVAVHRLVPGVSTQTGTTRQSLHLSLRRYWRFGVAAVIGLVAGAVGLHGSFGAAIGGAIAVVVILLLEQKVRRIRH